MPSVSPAQARLMAAAAHTPGGYGGVPQSVGEEFNAADAQQAQQMPKPRGRKVAQAMLKQPKMPATGRPQGI